MPHPPVTKRAFAALNARMLEQIPLAQELAHLWAATATPFVLVVTTVLAASPKENVIGWSPTTIVESSVSVARKVKVWSVLALVGSTVAARLVASNTATLHPQQSAEHSDLFRYHCTQAEAISQPCHQLLTIAEHDKPTNRHAASEKTRCPKNTQSSPLRK